jgi:hypothetical protein
MTVIARDGVAADHLVYAWPFPLGPECEVTCNDDEQVVMCPAWMVGDRLGPGRHRWRTPDPMRPVAAFFVLTSPVEVGFDLVTSFMIPMNGMPVRLRAVGSIQVRCADPGLLIAQFVGLPFDSVNEGILRSVSRSVERMLARLLTRRVVISGTPYAVTDPMMLGQIVEELIAYNPTAGAVFGIELIRMGYLAIGADDGNSPYVPMPVAPSAPPVYAGHFDERSSHPDIPPQEAVHEAARSRPISQHDGMLPEATPPPPAPPMEGGPSSAVASGEIVPRMNKKKTEPGIPAPPSLTALGTNPSGTVGGAGAAAGAAAASKVTAGAGAAGAGAAGAAGAGAAGAGAAGAGAASAGAAGAGAAGAGAAGATGKPEGARDPDETTDPAAKVPLPGAAPPPVSRAVPSPVSPPLPRAIPSPVSPPLPRVIPSVVPPPAAPRAEEPRGAILGIGMGAIGGSEGGVSGEIPMKIAPGQRVLVPGPNGLMQSATVRQLLQGYYELEVGSSGQTIWVPISGVVPE